MTLSRTEQPAILIAGFLCGPHWWTSHQWHAAKPHAAGEGGGDVCGRCDVAKPQAAVAYWRGASGRGIKQQRGYRSGREGTVNNLYRKGMSSWWRQMSCYQRSSSFCHNHW